MKLTKNQPTENGYYITQRDKKSMPKLVHVMGESDLIAFSEKDSDYFIVRDCATDRLWSEKIDLCI